MEAEQRPFTQFNAAQSLAPPQTSKEKKRGDTTVEDPEKRWDRIYIQE
jgi:hypothetical protein